jgi:hypothetical protein
MIATEKNMRARVPANAPAPTEVTKIIAQNRSGTVRSRLMKPLSIT